MAAKGKEPGEPESVPVESRRTPAATDIGAVTPDETSSIEDAETPSDMPEMGSLAPESARPTPLDDIAEAEREKLPND